MCACVAHACMRALRRVASCCVTLRRAASRFYAAFLSYNKFLHCFFALQDVFTLRFCEMWRFTLCFALQFQDHLSWSRDLF